jgi:hypothetical protein
MLISPASLLRHMIDERAKRRSTPLWTDGTFTAHGPRPEVGSTQRVVGRHATVHARAVTLYPYRM